MALLSIENLHLSIPSFEGEARILNGVDLSVERGEICGLVGETGCGKSLTGLSVSNLTIKGRSASTGRIFWPCPRMRCGPCAAAASA